MRAILAPNELKLFEENIFLKNVLGQLRVLRDKEK